MTDEANALSLLDLAAEAMWRRAYPNGGSVYKTYDSLPFHDKELHRKEAVEMAAAALWRSENPDMSVFDCDHPTKEVYRKRVKDGIAAPAPTVAHQALALTDAAIKDAVTEYLLHRGEQPYRVLRGGSELWETHVPAMKAAFEAVGRLHATAMTAKPVAGEPHDPSRYCALDACRREGCTHMADKCLSAQITAPPSPNTVREALELAEDVLSRAPFSNAIWPNGVHPQTGITKIRDAIAALSTAAVAVNGHVAGAQKTHHINGPFASPIKAGERDLGVCLDCGVNDGDDHMPGCSACVLPRNDRVTS